jgi:hypothetical protein
MLVRTVSVCEAQEGQLYETWVARPAISYTATRLHTVAQGSINVSSANIVATLGYGA